MGCSNLTSVSNDCKNKYTSSHLTVNCPMPPPSRSHPSFLSDFDTKSTCKELARRVPAVKNYRKCQKASGANLQTYLLFNWL